jgi:hypothetical protein
MKHIIFSFYLLILFFISFIKSIDNQCFFIDTDSFSFYSIYDLSRGKDDIDHNYPIPNTQKIIYFNFCAVLSKNKTAQVIIDNNGEKTMLSNDKPNENKWESFDDGVIIKLSSGEKCNETDNYSIKYKITCNDDIDELNVKKYEEEKCEGTLFIESKYGCPQFSVYNFWKLIHNNKVIFFIILFAIGIVLCFFGKKFIYVTIFIFSSIISVSVIFMFVFNVVLPKGTEADQTVLTIVFIISFIPGIGIGILIIKYQHFLLACVLGGVGGFFLSIFVYDLILNHWDEANKLYLKIIVYVVVIAICIGIGYLTIEHLKIITTSFVGSYSLVRGPTLFLDKFPNETEMADYFTNKEKLRDLGDNQDVLVKLIIFLICWIFFSILGMYIQYKMWDKKEDEDNDKCINSKGDPALTTFLNKKL